jgi:hypothetical protein
MKILQILLLWAVYTYAGTFSEQITQLKSATKIGATIPIGNLQNGQSGIVVSNKINEKSVIICYATVISSNEKESNISFQFQDILEQDALPKTNLLPKNGDNFVLNHLYKNSMIIAPNFQALDNTKKIYENLNFLSSDFFAAYLKINNNPTPQKKDIIEFAHKNDLGRIFIITDKNINTVDALSFKVIETTPFNFDDNTTNAPFYGNIDEIKTSTFDFFGASNIGDYNKYYKKLLGIKDGK